MANWTEEEADALAASIPTAALAALVHTPESSLRGEGGGSHSGAITLAGAHASPACWHAPVADRTHHVVTAHVHAYRRGCGLVC